MFTIRAQNPSQAWFEATRLIVEKGWRTSDLAREILHLLVEIHRPLKITPKIDTTFRHIIGDRWVDEIAADFCPNQSQLSLEEFPSIPKKGHYSYWARLINYDGINQLRYIIERLKKAPRSKQAFCLTFDPHLDIKPALDNPRRPYLLMPCLTALDFKFRQGKLSLFAFFRSHDFGRKAYGNYIGLGKLLEFVTQRTELPAGKLVVFSSSAHIRSKEFGKISKVLKALF